MLHRIPPDFIDHLLSRVDVVEWVHARVPLRRSGSNYVACCPFHEERTPSFTVSPTKQFYHCFGCGAHGSAIGFLMAYDRMNFFEAVTTLAHHVGMTLPEGVAAVAHPHQVLLTWTAVADQFFRQQLKAHPTAKAARDYLQQRGVSGAMIEQFGIGYAPPEWDRLTRLLQAQGAPLKECVQAGLVIDRDGRRYDRFRHRITFPIRDRRGRTVAFGARALADELPKYLNSPETPCFQKGQHVFGLYEAQRAITAANHVLIVEGYLDVIALAQHGIPHVVATLGTATTEAQLNQVFHLAAEVICCFDGDRAGRQAAWRAMEQALPLLRAERRVRFLFLPDGEDPDSLIRHEGATAFLQRIQQAQPLSDYVLEQVGATQRSTVEGRSQALERLKPLVMRLPEGVYRNLLIARCSEVFGVEAAQWVPSALPTAPKALVSANASNAKVANLPSLRKPVRWAIRLLLQQPSLAQCVKEVNALRQIDLPGIALLAELIELCQADPHIEPATLLARYQQTEEGRILEQIGDSSDLTEWLQHQSDEQIRQHRIVDFQQTLALLLNRYNPYQQLLAKAKQVPLTAHEREQLRHGSHTQDRAPRENT